jgi:uncharacterized membrane protein YphA (DoxX/SURF4 family)
MAVFVLHQPTRMYEDDKDRLFPSSDRVAPGNHRRLFIGTWLDKIAGLYASRDIRVFRKHRFSGDIGLSGHGREIALGLALLLGFMTRWAALAALPILIGSIIPHAGNGFLFSNPNGGWEYPVFWSIALLVQSILGDGAYAVGGINRVKA